MIIRLADGNFAILQYPYLPGADPDDNTPAILATFATDEAIEFVAEAHRGHGRERPATRCLLGGTRCLPG
jgi:hypothetical protein